MLRIILLLLVLPFALNAQIKIDTIFVSANRATYLLFPKDVDLADIPKDDYSASLDGKTVFIKAKFKHTPSNKIIVKCGDDFYEGVLVYKESPLKSLYDFRNYEVQIKTTTNVTTIVKKEKEEPLDTVKLIYKERLAALKLEGNKIKTVGELQKQSGMYLSFSNIKHDQNATYIKLKVSNSSNINYLIDFVTFEIVENRENLRNEIRYILEEVPRSIPSKDEASMYFVMPLLALPENTELKITLREKNGLRTVSLYVPPKFITTATKF